MPTLDDNKDVWDRTYDWAQAGDEWSSTWGDTETQWYNTILPRIYSMIPARTVLEIAPGFGRWTQFLSAQCERLILVDLSEKCIQACKVRFSAYSHISYYVNDGKSLDFIPDESIDFAFSFDSLVHAEDDVIAAYLNQLFRKLSVQGVGVIHYSNLGEHADYLALLSKIPYRLKKPLVDWGIIPNYARVEPKRA
jgi:ubiquinone/menaquinone biosynthesis C-methylase UbiE